MHVRALAAAAALIVTTSQSTASSAVFVAYRTHWGLSAAQLGIAFSVYVGTLIPILLLFGGLVERFGRRAVVLAGMLLMLAGTATLIGAHEFTLLIVGRMLQGAGAALAVGPLSARFTETFRGRIAAGQALAIVTAIALAGGPVVTAATYDLGAGPNRAYLPMLLLGLASLALLRFVDGRAVPNAAAAPERPLPAREIAAALRFAMPVAFVAWAGIALFLSLVPAYLASAMHASDPLVGAGAFLVMQIATVVASTLFGNVPAVRNATFAPMLVVAGLALLVVATNANLWWLLVAATLLTGGAAGVASGAAFGIAARVGAGQRARIFARLLVAAYAGYSIPSLATGVIASHATFTIAFVAVTAALAAIAIVVPVLRAAPSPVSASATV
jgi:MFS family permease